ncbi:Ankyrin repeat protein 1 [Giardia muris]|uniref:Ankyrin repeat protein 1 n=1 Tax=Giardia muris TaxID=5742 RepID=A0A4Z1SSH6_GIAMU|nr:Ankyrin repeat protein 1 [Giardia muris]|eukprot:TNJ26608.1 Ankyrin repeat protein 1 [Giardia muris]
MQSTRKEAGVPECAALAHRYATVARARGRWRVLRREQDGRTFLAQECSSATEDRQLIALTQVLPTVVSPHLWRVPYTSLDDTADTFLVLSRGVAAMSLADHLCRSALERANRCERELIHLFVQLVDIVVALLESKLCLAMERAGIPLRLDPHCIWFDDRGRLQADVAGLLVSSWNYRQGRGLATNWRGRLICDIGRLVHCLAFAGGLEDVPGEAEAALAYIQARSYPLIPYKKPFLGRFSQLFIATINALLRPDGADKWDAGRLLGTRLYTANRMRVTQALGLALDADGDTPLHAAIKAVRIDQVSGAEASGIDSERLLLKHGHHLRLLDAHGHTALQASVLSNRARIALALVEEEAGYKDRRHEYAAKAAMHSGLTLLIKPLLLFERQYLETDGFTSLMLAAAQGEAQLLTRCLHHARRTTKDGYCALHFAIIHCARSILAETAVTIISTAIPHRSSSRPTFTPEEPRRPKTNANMRRPATRGSSQARPRTQGSLAKRCRTLLDPDFDTDTNLQRCTEQVERKAGPEKDASSTPRIQQYFAIIRLLYPYEASLVTKDGYTPLMLAVTSKALPILQFLLDLPETAQDFTKQTNAGDTALMLAVRGRMTEAVRALLPYEGGLSSKAPEGHTALSLAAELGDYPSLSLLVSCPRERDQTLHRYKAGTLALRGVTPLMLAAIHGHTDCVHVLAPHEATLQEETFGYTALALAAHFNYPFVVESLIPYESGITLNNGWTALMIAAAAGNTACCAALVQHEARASTNGLTAYLLAVEKGHTDTAILLYDQEHDITLPKHAYGRAEHWSGLVLASAHGHIDLVSRLLLRDSTAEERALAAREACDRKIRSLLGATHVSHT